MGKFNFSKFKFDIHKKRVSPLKIKLLSLYSRIRVRAGRLLKTLLNKKVRERSLAAVGVLVLMLSFIAFFGFVSFKGHEKKTEVTEGGVKEAPPSFKRHKIKIAIILDDAGGETVDYNEIYSIIQPITISVLPNLSRSGKTVREAKALGKEALMHLPMEPDNPAYVRSDGGMVLTSMSDNAIREVVLRDLSTVPGVVGINNHMGSKATRDPRVTEVVLDTIKGKGLFFVDSRTSRDSLIWSKAKLSGIRSARNTIFLDVDERENAVIDRFIELVSIAKVRGSAIGIGHATRPSTIGTLKIMMAAYEKMGIEFVFASSLAN